MHDRTAELNCIQGDCIFDEAQRGAASLELAWEKATKKWFSLLKKSVQGGLFGFLPEVVSLDWILKKIYSSESEWPKSLSQEERKLLRLIRAVSAYHPLHELGHASKPLGKEPDQEVVERVLEKYIQSFQQEVALPMWSAYEDETARRTDPIAHLCEQVYEGPCSQSEASSMFQGELERGWKSNKLEWSPATYEVFPKFISWISA